MKNKLLLVIIYFLALFSLWLFLSYFYDFGYQDKSESNLPISSSTGILESQSGDIVYGTGILTFTGQDSSKDIKISLKNALSTDLEFNSYLLNIEEDYNYAQLLTDEFNKVKSLDDFEKFEEKFGNQIIMFTFAKILDKKGYLKYFDYIIDLENIEGKTGKTKEELRNTLTNIINDLKNMGYYDKLGYVNENGVYDYMQLSFMPKLLDEKLKICKKGFSKEDDYNSCVRFVTYMSATKENKYCKLLTKHDKKWCNDTLLLIK